MHHVKTVIYDRLCTFEFGIATEVFALPRPEFSFPWYAHQTVAAEGKQCRAMGGITIEAEGTLADLAQADTIILPGWRNREERPPQPLLDALIKAHKRGARLLSICSGVFILAATGLLNGKRATTHWRHVETLKAAYPGISVEPDVLYIDNGGLVTSAGSAAGIDASLHIVRQDYGSKVANSVARRLVLPPLRDGGQAQYIPPVQARTGNSIADVMHWARKNIGGQISLPDLAKRARMSDRSFQRRFRAEAGVSPMKWLQRERLYLAQELLETSAAPLAEIATLSGYESPDTFRIAFKRTLNTSPAAYRARFQ